MDTLVPLLTIVVAITAYRVCNSWWQKREQKRDAAAIKATATILKVIDTGVAFGNSYQPHSKKFDLKANLHLPDGTSKEIILTETFSIGMEPNPGDEVKVCINPKDQYDRWIP